LASLLLILSAACTEIYTRSLHDALPICGPRGGGEMTGRRKKKGLAAVRVWLSAIPHLFAKVMALHCVACGTAASFYALRILSRRSEEHTSELQSRFDVVCRLLLGKKTT